MSPRHNIILVGGYPLKVGKPEKIFAFFNLHHFPLVRLKTLGDGIGYDQLVFIRQ